MKRLLSSTFLILIALLSGAQTAPQYSLFMHNILPYNPAVAGRDNNIDITAVYRNQWTGVSGNPSLQGFSLHSPLTMLNSSAGVYIVNDQQGVERSTHFMLAYAYRKPLGFGDLAIGVSAGAIQKSLDGTRLRAPQGNYEGIIDHNDDYIPEKEVSAIAPEANAGVFFNSEKLYIGVSANNLLESAIKLESPGNENTEIHFARSYFAVAGYKFDVSRNIQLQPNVMVKSDLVRTQTDFNLILQYNSNIWGGFSFRGTGANTKDALAAMLGFNIVKNLKVAYAYDFTLSALNNANSGSHEVLLGYKLNIKELSKPGKTIYTPRFL